MITCPACGKENEDSAHECRRCRAPLRDDHEAQKVPAEALGEVCRRCEAFNEPGVPVCTNCGLPLSHAAASGAEPTARVELGDKTPPQAFAFAQEILREAPPASSDGSASLSQELRALAISDQEAAEAGLDTSDEPSLDKTPPQAFVPPQAPVTPSRPAPMVEAAVSRPPAPPLEKACASCGLSNPPAAKFCFDCGTPFARKAPATAPAAQPPPAAVVAEPLRPQPKSEPPPSIHVDEELVRHLAAESAAGEAHDSGAGEPEPAVHAGAAELEDAFEVSSPPHELAEEAPVELSAADEEPAPLRLEDLKVTSEGDPLPMSFVADEEPAEIQESDTPGEAAVEELQDELRAEPLEAAEAFPADEVLPALPEEAPFPVSLVAEKSGAVFALPYVENSIGSAGGQVELANDPFVAPHAATLTFAGDHLVLRDEGSANGVYVKVRESAPLTAGDSFIAGARLLRFDGPTDLAGGGGNETPLLGSPRPQAACVRVSEVLTGGRTGRTCHRAGPVIAIGRSGCDLNFPADPLLAARHAEIRLGEDGSAMLVDLGQGQSGVLLRVRGEADLQAGDMVQIGEQQLRLELS
jgi:hypothetical protein